MGDQDLQHEELPQENVTVEAVKEVKTEDKKGIPEFDYTAVDRKELLAHLSRLTNDFSPLEIKNEVELIKSIFYQKLSKEVAELKVRFLEANTAEGDEEPVFEAPVDETEVALKAVLAKYRKTKSELHNKIEKEREENLKLKLGLIEELKQLVTKEESIGKTFEAFHSIQERWRAVGSVPATQNNDLWQNYHLHIEHFYDYIKINKDLRDLDFKKNLETKQSLCEKAEALEGKKSAIEAFKNLQSLHQQWKETGPVEKELRDELWEKFKKATTIINKRHQDHFNEQKEIQFENLKKKEALCEKVEAIANNQSTKAKEWNDNVKKVQELQEEWRTVGIVPKKENTAIYKQFRKGCDLFFNNKRSFYKQQKDEQDNNLDKKKALLETAISLKMSEAWKDTSEELIRLQKEWKSIGPVPRKYSETIWEQFREACDTFFLKKKEFHSGNDDKQKENYEIKTALIEKIKVFEASESPQDDVKRLLAFKDEWLKIGHVPFKKKNEINSEYHNELNAQFDKLNLKKEDRELEKFRSKIEDINDKSGDKMYAERKKLAIRLKDLESEIGTWENNIGFLSKSKTTEALVKEYTKRIDKAKEQTLLLKKKIRMIDKS